MTARDRVRAIAPAKVNLRLEVLGERPDGYHEIRSWTLAVDLCDSLDVLPDRSGAVRLELVGPGATPDVPADGTNLVCRAAEAALDEGRRAGAIGPDAGVQMRLEKRIPSRAGLGGGSSDAAAAWLATAGAHALEIPADARDRALAAIGSDCAFFAAAGATGFALCEGRGERVDVRPCPTPDVRIALVTPSVECATADVYRALGKGGASPGSLFRNDLEEPALRAFPELERWRRLLDGIGPWSLSGSGSSFFAVFEAEGEADSAVAAVRRSATAAGLALRGSWTVRPALHGARLLESS